MPISADQSAVLEMLLTGGQDFDDLDDLFGLDEGETRKRARAALTELGGGRDPDENVALTDYLLGQADPIDRADAVRHLRRDPADQALAAVIAAELTERFPDAELPSLPSPPASKRLPKPPKPSGLSPSAAKPHGERPGAGDTSSERILRWPSRLEASRARLIAILATASVVLIVVVLAIGGVFDGDDSATDTGGGQANLSDDASSPLPDDGVEVTRVALVPEGNGDAAGAAIVGITTNDQPYLDLVIENLEPAPENQTYIAWFMFDEDRGYPIPNPIVPGRDGSYENRVPIPVEVSGAISRATAIEVSLSPATALAKAIEDAIKANDIAIERPGRTILRGDVPEPDQAGSGSGDQPAPGEGSGGG
jgi:hypothetical protein